MKKQMALKSTDKRQIAMYINGIVGLSSLLGMLGINVIAKFLQTSLYASITIMTALGLIELWIAYMFYNREI